jgi:hypothetical protein
MYKRGRLYFSWEDPLPLDVLGLPELSFFPERIILRSSFSSSDGRYLKESVYVPDFSSLGEDKELGGHEMRYLSINDPDAEIWLWASVTGEWMRARKYYFGRAVDAVLSDERWDRFFERVSQLFIFPEENCIVTTHAVRVIGS